MRAPDNSANENWRIKLTGLEPDRERRPRPRSLLRLPRRLSRPPFDNSILTRWLQSFEPSKSLHASRASYASSNSTKPYPPY